MKKLVFLFTLCSSLLVNAAGDVRAGEEKSAVCAACHGVKGVSQNPEWPNLAGQYPGYLVKQLQNFQSGHDRSAGIMTAMASGLTDQDRDDLAAFYGHQPILEGESSRADFKRGETLYRGGDFDKHITACIACHGPQGLGNGEAGFPVLSGQHAEYTLLQLQQFKSHQRRNDLNGIMQDISGRMDSDDMLAVAHYVAGLH